MTTERDDRIKVLREELWQERYQLESIRNQKAIDTAVTLDQRHELMQHSYNDIISQLGDVAFILKEHTMVQTRDEQQIRKLLEDEDRRRRDRDTRLDQLHNMITQIRDDQAAEQRRAEEERANVAAGPSTLQLRLLIVVIEGEPDCHREMSVTSCRNCNAAVWSKQVC
jgi:hypothetical protein